jgi:chemotaxis protein MotB
MFALTRRSRRAVNVWPAFVDALASVLLVFIFMLLIFVLAQFALSEILAGRNRTLDELSRQVSELADTLSLERAQSADLRATIDQLSARLQVTLGERDALSERLRLATERAQTAEAEAARLQTRLQGATATIATDKQRLERQQQELANLQADVSALRQLRSELERRVAELAAGLTRRDEELAATRERGQALQARVDLLNQQIAALREQLTRLAAALELAQTRVQEQKVQIADLGQRLNLALARKVDELQRYRSEFFGRLRTLLGEHPSIRIVGDRFVFQSELLFPTASATLVPEGRQQLSQLALTLKAVTDKIPPDINWILRVDGHTDRRSIRTDRYPSNWELSTERALSVVNYLISQGIPSARLAAGGFGEFQPLEKADTAEAYARNRRIEIKLTQP